MADKLHERASALENEFFAHRDQELLAKLREEMESEETRAALSKAIGIEDKEALDALVEHDIKPQTMLVIGLIPMVAVAWSDGVLEPAERDAITKAADGVGVKEGSASFGLLESWLAEKPGDDLLDAWKSYAGALVETLDAPALAKIRDQVIGRAESAAEAAGGFLGRGNKVSDSEQKVIDELKSTFPRE
jgi:hypothetical protein